MQETTTVSVATKTSDAASDPLERQRDALSDADAHGRERALAVAHAEFQRRGQGEPRTRHAERMAKGGIGYLVIEWPTEGQARLEEFLEQIIPTL